MNQADEAWVQELYRYNAPKLYKVVLRRLEDAEYCAGGISGTN